MAYLINWTLATWCAIDIGYIHTKNDTLMMKLILEWQNWYIEDEIHVQEDEINTLRTELILPGCNYCTRGQNWYIEQEIDVWKDKIDVYG